MVKIVERSLLMSKAEFEKWKFASSLPEVLILVRDYPSLPVGAIEPGMDIASAIPDQRIPLRLVFYTTPKRIHGLLHYDGTNQLFFMGYECGACGEVFLVPADVKDETGLAAALRHGCMEARGE